MRHFLAALVLSFTFLIPHAFAEEVPSGDGTGGGAGGSAQGVVTETKPAEAPVEPIQAEQRPTEIATTSAQTGVPAVPATSVTATVTSPTTSNPGDTQTPATLSGESTPMEGVSPWLYLVGLIGLALGGISGAYALSKTFQSKNKSETVNTCDAIEHPLNDKQYELSLVDYELSFYDASLRALQKKLEEKADEIKGKVIGSVKSTAKDALLGKKGESEARTAYDTAEKAYETYEDIQAKVKKAEEMVALLSAKKGALSAEAKTLEVSYAACIAKLPDAAKALATGGIKLAVPGVRPVRAVIFDWAGVMATEAFWIWNRKNEVDVAPIMAVDMKVNTGEMPHEEFVALVARVSGKTPRDVWAGIKAEMILNEDLIALIRELKKKYKIGLLSDFTAVWLREILDENKLWDLFDEHIISSEHKLVKPDSKIFKKILTMLDVAPDEAIFADDRQINIDAAQKLGVRGFLFTDVEQFKKDLKSVGVSVKPSPETGSKSQ